MGPNGEELFLHLNKAVYGLKQSSRCFFNHVAELLAGYKLVQLDNDPCLFISKSILVVVYVDDILMFSKDDTEFGKLVDYLKLKDIAIRLEGSAEGFLGVDVKREMTDSGPQITLLQTGLTHCIISALGLSSSLSIPSATHLRRLVRYLKTRMDSKPRAILATRPSLGCSSTSQDTRDRISPLPSINARDTPSSLPESTRQH